MTIDNQVQNFLTIVVAALELWELKAENLILVKLLLT